ncbi:MAG TPA: HAMP domain-containing sensor histidine kinase [Bacteroidota bacterium]|nr:HAMP domain-containing sensor histidine kinase [Bacteroidota bacterium]
MKRPGTIRSIALILLLLVLLPVLVFSIYQFVAIGSSEAAVREIYRRELDVVLFSVNQFAWDVVNNYSSQLTSAWSASSSARRVSGVRAFLSGNPPVESVCFADSSGERILWAGSKVSADSGASRTWRDEFRGERPLLDRLIKFSRQNYRKIEPLTKEGGRDQSAALLFVIRSPVSEPVLAGMRLDQERFVTGVLAERLTQASAGSYVLAVIRRSSGERILSSEGVSDGDFSLRRQLWLFPDLDVGIRLKGESIEDIARSRLRRDLAFLIIVDVVLLAGVFVAYRSVRREMELVRLKSDFVSNVSHELRTPLALIRMYAETLEMGRLKSQKKRNEYYSTIVKESDRLTRLVNNLLNFSRMEAGRKPYNLASTDLNATVRSVLNAFAAPMQSQGIAPSVVLDPAIPHIQADAEAVQEALINIIDNAIKYSPKVKFLRIQTGTAADGISVEIEDHGIGISSEYHRKIFETFYRASSDVVPGASGSGLGLTIAKHIMDAHGGRIELRSSLGKGSTFRLVFPLGRPGEGTRKG